MSVNLYKRLLKPKIDLKTYPNITKVDFVDIGEHMSKKSLILHGILDRLNEMGKRRVSFERHGKGSNNSKLSSSQAFRDIGESLGEPTLNTLGQIAY